MQNRNRKCKKEKGSGKKADEIYIIYNIQSPRRKILVVHICPGVEFYSNAQMIQRSDNTCELTINERNICIITTF